MKRVVLAALVLGLTPVVAAAQRVCATGSGGWGNEGRWGRVYDPTSVVTIDGTVSAVERFAPPRGMSKGIHLVLATPDGKLTILLGPAWYVDRQDATLSVGDKVQVVGSRTRIDADELVIAKTVAKGDQVLQLRDESGIPLWAGCRRR